MSLTSRITVQRSHGDDPEDYFASVLGVVFPDDVTTQHGDASSSLVYTSPHLPKPLELALCDPISDEERQLFSHHLWNSSLLLAELMEHGERMVNGVSFSVAGQSCIELGAGSALPSIMAGLLGAEVVTVTDYPSDIVLSTIKSNLYKNMTAFHSPRGVQPLPGNIHVDGHRWGSLHDDFSAQHEGAYTRVLACDCLWMPWQHAQLRNSIAHFLSQTDSQARAWVIGGFHTGRARMRGFFDELKLRSAGLVVEKIWEKDCTGQDRPWSWDRDEDVTARKRWLVVAVLRRLSRLEGSTPQ